MSCIPNKPCKEESINWGSSARGKQDMVYIEADGRIWFDLLPYVRMNYNFGNYKLATVCQEILKSDNKDDLKIKDMFRYYREKDKVGLAQALNYCTQDSNVVLMLWEKMLTWFDITATGTVCCVPAFYIIAKAQQIRIVSQMLNYCMQHNIILETNIHKPDDNTYVEGALVTPPIAGLYKNICPEDFASLYPSIIRAYNIDYTTIVTDPNIPMEDTHNLEWETHIACSCPKSDGSKPVKNKNGIPRIICTKYCFRWLKQPKTDSDKGYKGIIPTLIKNLLDARKNTRKVIAQNEKLIDELKQDLTSENKRKINDLKDTNSVLNKRQLAFKVSANSMYGILGAAAGYLPLLQGAMSVTFMGRTSIMKASKYIAENHGGKIIYNDTDSAYVQFAHLNDKPLLEIWNHALHVSEDTSKLFPEEMKLEFENAIYSPFLIFSKKRYVGLVRNEKGEIEDKWKISGIVLKRRDNCTVLKELYKHMIEFVLYNVDGLTKLTHIQDYNKLIEDYKIAKRGITAKKRKDDNEVTRNLTKMEQQMKEWEILSRKNETVRELMLLVDSYISAMFLMDKYKAKDYVIVKGLTKDVYAAKTVPPHVAVANKMKQRNQIVQTNDRIAYLLIDKGYKPGTLETQDVKAEDYEFFMDNCEWLRVDFLYYMEKQIINPCEQIFEVACGVHGFVESLYNYRFNHKMMIYSLKQKLKPKVNYID